MTATGVAREATANSFSRRSVGKNARRYCDDGGGRGALTEAPAAGRATDDDVKRKILCLVMRPAASTSGFLSNREHKGTFSSSRAEPVSLTEACFSLVSFMLCKSN